MSNLSTTTSIIQSALLNFAISSVKFPVLINLAALLLYSGEGFDFIDAVKRAAGSAGAGHNMATSLIEEELGIMHSHQNSHLFTHIDPVFKGEFSKSKVINGAGLPCCSLALSSIIGDRGGSRTLL